MNSILRAAFAAMLFGSLGQVLCDPTLISSEGAVFQFEGLEAAPGECQTCLSFYEESNGKDNGWFRHLVEGVYELDGSGDECCYKGGDCSYNVGCNWHAVNDWPPIFTEKAEDDSATFNSTVRAGAGQEEPCNPPGTALPCIPFKFENEIIEEEKDIPIADQSFSLLAQSLHQKFTIGPTWPFSTTSTGMRIKMQVMSRESWTEDFYVQPGNILTGEDDIPVEDDSFDGIVLTDENGYNGGIYFSRYAVLDGSSVASNVTIRGPFPHEYDYNARYIYLEIPKFSSKAELHFNVFLPAVSGTDEGGLGPDKTPNGLWQQHRMAFIIGIAVGSGCILCICIGTIIHKIKSRRRRGH